MASTIHYFYLQYKNPPSAKQKAEVIPWKELSFPRLHYFFSKKVMSRKNPPSEEQKAEVIPWKERIPTVFEGARVKIYTALAP